MQGVRVLRDITSHNTGGQFNKNERVPVQCLKASSALIKRVTRGIRKAYKHQRRFMFPFIPERRTAILS